MPADVDPSRILIAPNATTIGQPFIEVLTAQELAAQQLLEAVNAIKAVDNHTHILPARSVPASDPIPENPLGVSPPFFSVRQRETNPEWIEAWHALSTSRCRRRASSSFMEGSR